MTKLISTLSTWTVICISLVNYPDQTSASSARDDTVGQRQHCDKKLCDPIVTKCTSSGRCSCGDLKYDPSCAKDCIDCLEQKFDKCCACVGSCPILNDNVDPNHVGEIGPSPDEQLFSVLTETDDIHGRWVVASTTTDALKHSPGGEQPDSPNSITSQTGSPDRRRCLMAFINKHLHMDQCKRYCRAMGASYFQWFHDGCCECAGRYCLKYGLPEARCLINPD